MTHLITPAALVLILSALFLIWNWVGNIGVLGGLLLIVAILRRWERAAGPNRNDETATEPFEEIRHRRG